MSAALIEQAPAKINLTLRVRGRRADGYHELDSLVAFADLADELRLLPDRATTLDVEGPFAAASGPADGNLVIKAVAALAARVPALRAGRLTLVKNIPVAAGLGGGSSDAAAALRLLARLNGLASNDPRLAAAARAVGADVPVCLDPRPRIMTGIGEDLSVPLDLPALAAVLVNPGVALLTAEVFAAYRPAAGEAAPATAVPSAREALFGWLAAAGNDLTAAAIARAPVVQEVLDRLAQLPRCRLARMSGSGATCFALFDSAAEADVAAAQLRGARADWWICPTMLR